MCWVAVMGTGAAGISTDAMGGSKVGRAES